MSIENLDKIFQPKSIAVVGASERKGSVGKKIGEPGQKLEAAIQKNAMYSGLRIIGPNCVGIISGRSKLNPTFHTFFYRF